MNKTIEIAPERIERPGREIRVDKELNKNPNITGKIGTVHDKNCPHTVYISIGFWIDIKNKPKQEDGYFGEFISKKFGRELSRIYKKDLRKILKDNRYFPFSNDNIYVYDFPHNLTYNKKRSFVSIELNLHTINCLSKKTQYPLKTKRDTKLFDELLKVYNTIATSKLLKGKLGFTIHKSKD